VVLVIVLVIVDLSMTRARAAAIERWRGDRLLVPASARPCASWPWVVIDPQEKSDVSLTVEALIERVNC
jgi:hypothetical protein